MREWVLHKVYDYFIVFVSLMCSEKLVVLQDLLTIISLLLMMVPLDFGFFITGCPDQFALNVTTEQNLEHLQP